MKAKQKMKSKLHFGTVAFREFYLARYFQIDRGFLEQIYLMIGPWTISVKLIFLPD